MPSSTCIAPGVRALDGRDRFAVEAELQDVGGLLGPRQLRVERLVAPAPERRRLLDALEEVRAASPVAADERRLLDDLRAGAHRLDRGARRALEVPAVGADDVDDLAAGRAQAGQVRGLVRLALAPEQVAVIVRRVWSLAGAARDLEASVVRCGHST